MSAANRQVIHVHLGQFGIHSGKCVWQLYCKEHGIEIDGTISESGPIENIYRFNCFTECNEGVAKPKSLFLDMSNSSIGGIQNSNLKGLFDKDFMIAGREDACTNFARARYGVSRQIFIRMFNAMRSLLEECDCAKTCITFRASGGGCGSGVSPGALQFVHDQSLKSILIDLAPSDTFTNYMIAPYNHILSMAQCDEVCDLVIPLQNESLDKAIRRHMFGDNVVSPLHATISYNHINEEIARMMSHLGNEKFYGNSYNMNWSGMVQNLVPFPDLKYMTIYDSKNCAKGPHYVPDTAKLVICSCLVHPFINDNSPAGCSETSYVIADVWCFRGIFNYDQIARCFEEFDKPPFSMHHGNRFVPYIPQHMKLCNFESPVLLPDSFVSNAAPTTCVRVCNESGIEEFFLDNLEKYSALYNTGSFVHWYLYEGMVHDEFEDSFNYVKQIADRYGSILDRNEDEEDEEYMPLFKFKEEIVPIVNVTNVDNDEADTI